VLRRQDLDAELVAQRLASSEKSLVARDEVVSAASDVRVPYVDVAELRHVGLSGCDLDALGEDDRLQALLANDIVVSRQHVRAVEDGHVEAEKVHLPLKLQRVKVRRPPPGLVVGRAVRHLQSDPIGMKAYEFARLGKSVRPLVAVENGVRIDRDSDGADRAGRAWRLA
jgi:hypothetical protein